MEKDIKGHLITGVKEGSIAQEVGIEPMDRLIAINDQEIKDIFDYQYLIENSEVNVLIEKPNNEPWLLEIEKDEDEDLGIIFDKGLMDDYKSCHNKCIFCFIDQMPKGMRDTLYFKDDDSRLSFLQGNYVTLTNMSDEDVDRIIRYHLSPINVSIQTTNPTLRNKMLNNRFAGEALSKFKKLCNPSYGIELNAQIVLCKGINDGEELHRSLLDLYECRPSLKSVSVVPVGLSRFREGLFPLKPFSKEDALKVVEEISYWQELSYRETSDHFVHASDEWFMIADLPIPDANLYDGYGQLENGVGMVRLMIDDFHYAMGLLKDEAAKNQKLFDYLRDFKYTNTVVSGKLIHPYVSKLMDEAMDFCPGLKVNCAEIINHFFGEGITVTGLLTGRDIIDQLKDKKLGDRLLLPSNILRAGEDYLLDDVTVSQIEEALDIKIEILSDSGNDLIDKLFRLTENGFSI
mgnify:CR=1 FL=1